MGEPLLWQAQAQWPETASGRWQGLQGCVEDTSQYGQVEGSSPQCQSRDGLSKNIEFKFRDEGQIWESKPRKKLKGNNIRGSRHSEKPPVFP